MSTELQDERFFKITRELQAVADRLTAESDPTLPPALLGTAFIAIGLALLIEGVGPDVAAGRLRRWTDQLLTESPGGHG